MLFNWTENPDLSRNLMNFSRAQGVVTVLGIILIHTNFRELLRRRRCLRTCLKTKNSAGGGVTFRVPFGGKTAPGSPFLRDQILSSALKGLEKALKSGCKKSGAATVTPPSTTTDRFWPIWTPGADPLIWQNRCAMGQKVASKSCTSGQFSRALFN